MTSRSTKKPLVISLDELIEAMTTSIDAADWRLNLATGKITFSGDEVESDEVDETEGTVEIPSIEASLSYRWMERFAAGVDEEDVREKLEIALQGKGAFGRFRSVVQRFPDIADAWRAFHDQEVEHEASLWLDGLGIEPKFKRVRQVPSTPEIVTSAVASRIRLEHVLVLGMPAGTADGIGGRVVRSVSQPNEGAARKLFISLARDLCVWRGVEWRNRFIKGTGSFALEGIELRLEGRCVEVTIEVPPELRSLHSGQVPEAVR